MLTRVLASLTLCGRRRSRFVTFLAHARGEVPQPRRQTFHVPQYAREQRNGDDPLIAIDRLDGPGGDLLRRGEEPLRRRPHRSAALAIGALKELRLHEARTES